MLLAMLLGISLFWISTLIRRPLLSLVESLGPTLVAVRLLAPVCVGLVVARDMGTFPNEKLLNSPLAWAFFILPAASSMALIGGISSSQGVVLWHFKEEGGKWFCRAVNLGPSDTAIEIYLRIFLLVYFQSPRCPFDFQKLSLLMY